MRLKFMVLFLIACGLVPISAVAIPCGTVLTSSFTLTNNMTCPGTAFYIGASNVTLNLNGYRISSTGSQIVIIEPVFPAYTPYDNVKILGPGYIRGNESTGILASYTSNALIQGITFEGVGIYSGEGSIASIGLQIIQNGFVANPNGAQPSANIVLAESNGSTISGNNFANACGQFAIETGVFGPVTGTIISSNYIRNCYGGLYINNGSKNKISDNIIIDTGNGGAISLAESISGIGVTDTLVTNNSISGSIIGISLYSPSGLALITGNEISNNRAWGSGIGVDTQGDKTSGNKIQNNTLNGYSFFFHGNAIQNNSYSGNTCNGNPC